MRRWLSAALVVLGLGGLLLMHGLDPAAHAPAVVDTATTASAAHVGDHGPAHRPASPGERPDDVDVTHVAALCVAILATVAAHVARHVRTGWSVAPRIGAQSAWARYLGDAFRPPGPGRLALCILRC